VVPALSGAALACLALVVGWSPDLLFLLPTSAAAMVVAWRAQLNRPLGTAALSAVYVIVAVTAVAGTVPGHHYRTLGVVAFGLIGTAAYGAFGLPVPGDNRHIFILIVPAVLFHSQTWLLVVWAVAAFVLGLLLNRRSPEPMIAVAFAVTAALCSAAEVWLAR
jgi:hypothetical protein